MKAEIRICYCSPNCLQISFEGSPQIFHSSSRVDLKQIKEIVRRG